MLKMHRRAKGPESNHNSEQIVFTVNILISALGDAQLCMNRQIRNIIPCSIRKEPFAMCAGIAIFCKNGKNLIHLADIRGRCGTADSA